MAVLEYLFSDRIIERLRGAQGLVRLAERYGDARVEAACTRALAHGSPHYRTVKTILAGGYDLRPLEPHGTRPEFVHGRTARFHRDAETLFGTEGADPQRTRH